MPHVWFVGAGPGAVDLITVRGRKLISEANAILYAGSLVNAEHLGFAPANCISADSSGMTLDEMTAWLLMQCRQFDTVVRLQTGDPSLYGALAEMAQPLLRVGVTVTVVPGVSSALASAACAMQTLTLPEVTQTVIFTRIAGRTPMPAREQLQNLAKHKTTLCIFLAATLMEKVVTALSEAGWSWQDPILVVYKASWPGEEKIVRSTLANIVAVCRQEKLTKQTMIIVGPTLSAPANMPTSQLYNPKFSHGFRTV